jgi:dienelactone hydrolase
LVARAQSARAIATIDPNIHQIAAPMRDAPSPSVSQKVQIGDQHLDGTLTIPDNATGLVIFAHGSGSSRLSPRNIQVAEALNKRGFATLLFDLLTAREATDRNNVFDIARLGARVSEAVAWAHDQRATTGFPVGLFGASTGAAAALVAAAQAPAQVSAVVSRGGRPDLAGAHLTRVRAPTLLIVGGADHGVIELNEQALAKLKCPHRLEIVPGATHLFEETGALERVVALAGDWFQRHLQG